MILNICEIFMYTQILLYIGYFCDDLRFNLEPIFFISGSWVIYMLQKPSSLWTEFSDAITHLNPENVTDVSLGISSNEQDQG